MIKIFKNESVTIECLLDCDCDDVKSATVHPDYFFLNGTPICPECGKDMKMGRVIVDVPESKKRKPK
jgi:hypothetical protein